MQLHDLPGTGERPKHHHHIFSHIRPVDEADAVSHQQVAPDQEEPEVPSHRSARQVPERLQGRVVVGLPHVPPVLVEAQRPVPPDDIGIGLCGRLCGFFQRHGLQPVVGVEEGQVIPSGGFQPAVARSGDAAVPLLPDDLAGDAALAPELFQERGRPVGAAVIHEDHFEITERLLPEGLQALRKAVRRVVYGHDEGNRHRFARFSIRSRKAGSDPLNLRAKRAGEAASLS